VRRRIAGSLAAAFAAVLPLACVVWPEGSGPNAAVMPLAEALERRDRGEAVLLDLRSREDYAQGHIPGALNIPLDEVAGRATEIRRMAKLPILYCG
jgi:3-mercaptopyruvate sulfurtransferase SseA